MVMDNQIYDSRYSIDRIINNMSFEWDDTNKNYYSLEYNKYCKLVNNELKKSKPNYKKLEEYRRKLFSIKSNSEVASRYNMQLKYYYSSYRDYCDISNLLIYYIDMVNEVEKMFFKEEYKSVLLRFNNFIKKNPIDRESKRLYNKNFEIGISSSKNLERKIINYLGLLGKYKVTYGCIDKNSMYPNNSVDVKDRLLLGDMDTIKKIKNDNKDISLIWNSFYSGYGNSYYDVIKEISNESKNRIRYDKNSELNKYLSSVLRKSNSSSYSKLLGDLDECIELLKNSNDDESHYKLCKYRQVLIDIVNIEECINYLDNINDSFCNISFVSGSVYFDQVNLMIISLGRYIFNKLHDIDFKFVNKYIDYCKKYIRDSKKLDNIKNGKISPISNEGLSNIKEEYVILSEECNKLSNRLGMSKKSRK